MAKTIFAGTLEKTGKNHGNNRQKLFSIQRQKLANPALQALI